MAQVDTVSYFPSLVWFVLNLVLLYILIVIYILPLIYTVLKSRVLYLFSLENILNFSEKFLNKFNIFVYLLNRYIFINKNFIYIYLLFLLNKNKLKLYIKVKKLVVVVQKKRRKRNLL